MTEYESVDVVRSSGPPRSQTLLGLTEEVIAAAKKLRDFCPAMSEDLAVAMAANLASLWLKSTLP